MRRLHLTSDIPRVVIIFIAFLWSESLSVFVVALKFIFVFVPVDTFHLCLHTELRCCIERWALARRAKTLKIPFCTHWPSDSSSPLFKINFSISDLWKVKLDDKCTTYKSTSITLRAAKLIYDNKGHKNRGNCSLCFLTKKKKIYQLRTAVRSLLWVIADGLNRSF